MKRVVRSLFLGILAFGLTYLALCYLIPGWRIKLEAESMAYFVESLRSMALIKSMISASAAVGLGLLLWLMKR